MYSEIQTCYDVNSCTYLIVVLNVPVATHGHLPSFLKNSKFLSHRILRHMHGILNIDKNKNIYTVCI